MTNYNELKAQYIALQSAFECFANHHEECPMMQIDCEENSVCNCNFRARLEDSRNISKNLKEERMSVGELQKAIANINPQLPLSVELVGGKEEFATVVGIALRDGKAIIELSTD